MMGLGFELVKCSGQYAKKNFVKPSILEDTVILSPVKIPDDKLKGSVEYTIVPFRSDVILKFLKSENQKVTELKGLTQKGEIKITVSVNSLPGNVTFPYRKKDRDALNALVPNNWVQSDNKFILSLAKKAVQNAADAADAAKKIEKFVSDYIKNRNLNTGYASALEVAKSRSGDCTEFAVLTAAMCRAIKIPARVIFGVVYVKNQNGPNGSFVGHAWVQVYLNGSWYDIDSALLGFNAGHIAIASGSGNPADFIKVIKTLGYFKIKSIEF
jgi:transglutaminase-like putative cysteine protease